MGNKECEIERLVYDPYLVFYADLGKHDGGVFQSDDAHGHVCTATGVTWGIQGGTFNGTGDIISVADSALLSFGNGTTDVAFSVVFWAKITAATNPRFMSKGAAAKYEYTIGTDGSDHFKVQFNSGGEAVAAFLMTYVSTDVFPTGTMTMFAVTYPGDGVAANIKVYFNKIQKVGTTAKGATYTAMNDYDQPLTIGKLWNDSANYFTGTMDGIIFHKGRVLTSLEISNIYEATKGRYQ